MSDEQNAEKLENKCNGNLVVILLSITLILSFLSFGLLVFNTVNSFGGVSHNDNGKVVISKKYDRGQTLLKAYKKQKPVVVFFYADWCGFCQRFAPTFAKVVKDKQIKKNFAVAYVNCDKPENRDYMEQFKIQGFPTVYVIKNDRSRVQLENHTFFNDDSVDVIKNNMLKIIGEE